MTASPTTRYRLDDLRQLGTALGFSLGVAPSRASALATHLLWFDAAGVSTHGIATLPTWLDRLASKQVDPLATGKPVLEHAGTAVFDAQQGIPPLALETACGIASEKARDVGIGIVRVRNIGPTGPSAPLAAGLAIGPFVAMIAGPSPSIAMALPSPDGLPAVFDSELARAAGSSSSPPEGWTPIFSPWVSTVAGDDAWVILALSVPAFESLSSFHERTSRVTRSSVDRPGTLWPESLARRRQEAREHGVALDPASAASLKEWAERTKVPWPSRFGG